MAKTKRAKARRLERERRKYLGLPPLPPLNAPSSRPGRSPNGLVTRMPYYVEREPHMDMWSVRQRYRDGMVVWAQTAALFPHRGQANAVATALNEWDAKHGGP